MKYSAKALNDVDGSIASAIKSFGTTKRLIQVAAVAILIHAKKTGDVRKANTLVTGLKGLNQTALVEFFVKFGGFVVDKEAKGFAGLSIPKENIDVEGGKKVMWYDLKVQNPWEGFNLKAGVVKLVKEAKKAETRVEKDESLSAIVSINPEMLEALEKLVA